MKKTLLVSLCCVMIIVMLSCNERVDIDWESIINQINTQNHNSHNPNTLMNTENSETATSQKQKGEIDETKRHEYNENHTIACNGVYYNQNIQYTINQNSELILHVNDWNESFVVPNQDMRFIWETLHASSVVLGDNQGALIFSNFSMPPQPIKVIQFSRGNSQVTIKDLTYQTDEHYRFKYCNFIDEQTGYLFLFSDSEIKPIEFLKTSDGGITWIMQPLENIPSLYWKADVICAKMLNENVGIISGQHWADDNMSERTYVTTDGGITWKKVVLPTDGPYVSEPDSSTNNTYMASIEVYDILYQDDKYILCFKWANANAEDLLIQYTSNDLENWEDIVN